MILNNLNFIYFENKNDLVDNDKINVEFISRLDFINQLNYNELFFYDVQTKFGKILVILFENKILKIYFTNNFQETLRNLELKLKKSITKINKYNFDLFSLKSIFTLLLIGNDLDFLVWNELKKIPSGRVISYSELAKMINKPNAIRAVASSVAKNEIAYLIPCHRVVKKNSNIGNYKWGSDVKEKLLKWELIESISKNI